MVEETHLRNTIFKAIEDGKIASSAPQARGVGKGSGSGSDVVLQCLIYSELEIAEVILADVESKHLVDDRLQVMERANRLEGDGVGRSEDAARCGQKQGVFDSNERDAAIVKSGRKETIIAADDAGSARGAAIGVKNLRDVIVFGDLHDMSPREFSLGAPARRVH